jgi:hypothetical protein
VLYTVAARNFYGWGATSQQNTAAIATIQTEPAAPSAPVYAATSSTLTTVVLTWAGITAGSADTGASPITSYNLQWRLASGVEADYADV